MDPDRPLPREIAAIVGEVARIASFLWEKGWAERNAGNLSVDVSDAALESYEVGGGPAPFLPAAIPSERLRGATLLVTASGARFRDLSRDPERGLLLVRTSDRLDGLHVLRGVRGGARPTSELASHLRIHAEMRESGLPYRAVLHTHPPHLIALTHAPGLGASADALSKVLWSMLPEVRVCVPEGVGLAPYRLPGGEALADATVAALAGRRVVLWEKHGCVAVERDVVEAFDLLDTLDKAARVYLTCRAAGFEPEGLPADALAELDELGRRLAPDRP